MKTIFFLVSLFCTHNSFAQEFTVEFHGQITNSDTGKKEKGVKVLIFDNDSLIGETTTSSNGKYSMNIMASSKGHYSIHYQKEGLVSKFIQFKFDRINIEDLPTDKNFEFVTLDLDLFEERKNVDFSFLKTTPIAIFRWSPRNMAMELDRARMEQIRRRTDEMLKERDKH
jgi:hypothetical protein